MRCQVATVLIAGTLLLATGSTFAGMPSPLPSNLDLKNVVQLDEYAAARLQAISFFLVSFLFVTAIIRLLWNYIQRDFPWLPRLSYGKALAVVFLWGLLFIVVLTMISGARELMTPGAWEKQGFTYKLAPAQTGKGP